MIHAEDFQREMNLTCLVSSTRDAWDIRTADVNRPGMQLCGFYEYFAFERPQVIGRVEMAYLEQQTPERRRAILDRYFSYPIPCLTICRNMKAPDELLEIARQHDVFVFSSRDTTSKFAADTLHYLNRKLAPRATRHGVLLDVFGVGILLSGRSGIGKSEAALELIKRGHQLVADDVVEICRISDDRLIGSSPSNVRYLMEIRGIGVIDIKAMFGIGAVTVSKTIDLVIELESWEESRFYDRIGLQDQTIEILGVPIPYQTVPVKAGRNLAIILEVAARNLSLKRTGFSAVQGLQASFREEEEIAPPDGRLL